MRKSLSCLAAIALMGALMPSVSAQMAVPDPMAGQLPNPMVPLPNPMVQGQPIAPALPVAPVAPNPMTAPSVVAPLSPLSPMGGAGNPMLGGQRSSGVDVALREDLDNLPDTAGVEDTYYSCTPCHSAQTFAQQRLTDARWEYLWDWMINEQNMPDYGSEQREIILGYLQTHFSSQR